LCIAISANTHDPKILPIAEANKLHILATQATPLALCETEFTQG
jgi:hypothetical protein